MNSILLQTLCSVISIVLSLSQNVNVTNDALCCESTSYSSNWWNCKTAAGLWGFNSCSTCASYQCIDWTAGSKGMLAREKTFLSSSGQKVYLGVGSYGNNQARAGKCYRMTVSGVDRDIIAQVVNQGGDVPDGNFDLQMGDGGFGIYNGCTSSGSSAPQYDGASSQWGNMYGGWYDVSGCKQLPQYGHCTSSNADNLQDLCTWSFNVGLRNGNPKITKMCEVKCPSELYSATGLHRSDEANSQYTCGSSVSSGGEMTRMMDCSKPSYGWVSNVKGSTYKGFEQVIPCRRNGYTRINQ